MQRQLRIKPKLDILTRVSKAVLFKKKSFLMASWHLTYKCNLRCKYCHFWERKVNELETAEAYKIIKELNLCKVKIIVFSGGESLLRDDFPSIIKNCKRSGMFVSLNTNGTLLEDRIRDIQMIDAVKISLDEPEDVNDSIRGKRCF